MMSLEKSARLSGWGYAPTDVLDIQARPLFCAPSVATQHHLAVHAQTVGANATPANRLQHVPDRIASGHSGARVEPDVYCGTETYRGVALRYTQDPLRPGAVRVYVESPIDWKGRDSSPHPTHLWGAGHDGRPHPPYLCIKAEFAPKSYEAAKKAAEQWIRGTEHYIASGRTISERIANGETI